MISPLDHDEWWRGIIGNARTSTSFKNLGSLPNRNKDACKPARNDSNDSD